jgi:CBS-domain-containing membrane protein
MNWRDYFAKMKGGGHAPPRIGLSEIVWSGFGVALGIGICAYLSSHFLEPRDLTLMIGSIGASAVLVYGAVKSPLAQPRNVVGGHVIAGLAGVISYGLFGHTLWVAAAIAVSGATVAMLLTQTLHPPGGATALIAVIGGQKTHELGFLFPFIPAGAGALVLVVVALLVNNLARNRRYPEYWL